MRLCYTPQCQNNEAGLLLLGPAYKIVDSKTSSVDFNPGVVLANAQARFTRRFCFMSKWNIGPKNGKWKGGRTVRADGYVRVRVGIGHPVAHCDGYAYEHRLRAWEAGLEIKGKSVHHEDEVKSNNEQSNLVPLTRVEHRSAHRKPNSRLRPIGEDNLEIACECGCGTTFLRYDAANRPRRFFGAHKRKGKPT